MFMDSAPSRDKKNEHLFYFPSQKSKGMCCSDMQTDHCTMSRLFRRLGAYLSLCCSQTALRPAMYRAWYSSTSFCPSSDFRSPACISQHLVIHYSAMCHVREAQARLNYSYVKMTVTLLIQYCWTCPYLIYWKQGCNLTEQNHENGGRTASRK